MRDAVRNSSLRRTTLSSSFGKKNNSKRKETFNHAREVLFSDVLYNLICSIPIFQLICTPIYFEHVFTKNEIERNNLYFSVTPSKNVGSGINQKMVEKSARLQMESSKSESGSYGGYHNQNVSVAEEAKEDDQKLKVTLPDQG
jgi:hypothetical protein